jgi:excisionase family DNA binding protein
LGVPNIRACVYISAVTVKQAALALGLSPATLRHQIAKGRLRAVKAGRDWDITEDEVRRYKAESRGHPGRRRKTPTLGLFDV